MVNMLGMFIINYMLIFILWKCLCIIVNFFESIFSNFNYLLSMFSICFIILVLTSTLLMVPWCSLCALKMSWVVMGAPTLWVCYPLQVEGGKARVERTHLAWISFLPVPACRIRRIVFASILELSVLCIFLNLTIVRFWSPMVIFVTFLN